MRYALGLLLLLAVPGFSQTAQTGKAETTGFCSPAVTGGNNQFTITCQNIPDKLRTQLVDLLNRVAKNQADAEAVMSKLDGCLESIKQIRDQAAPWNMTEGQKKELKHLLTGTKAAFAIHYVPPDRNSYLFATDLYSALQDSGWTPSGFVTDYSLNPNLVGIVVAVSHEDFPEAVRLKKALESVLGSQVLAVLDTENKLATTEHLIYIGIGGKPPVTH